MIERNDKYSGLQNKSTNKELHNQQITRFGFTSLVIRSLYEYNKFKTIFETLSLEREGIR